MSMFKKCTIVYKDGNFDQLIGVAFSYVIRDGFVIVTCLNEFSCLGDVEYEHVYSSSDIRRIEVSS